MPRRHRPTARQERLGTELRRLREAAGLKLREASVLLDTDTGHLSQVESGVAGASGNRVRRLCAHYSCQEEQLTTALVHMATDRTRGWWEEYRGLLPTPFLDLAELEYHSSFRRDVELLHVPGLLQTEDYARALFSFTTPDLPVGELDACVSHRMRRRKALYDRKIPYAVVVHEAALRIMVGDRAASRTQLAHILDLSEPDNVTVRVIPFSLERFAGAGSTMVYVDGPVPRLDTVVRDGPHGTKFLDFPTQLARYRALFHRLEELSLPPTASRDLIHRLAKEL